MDDLGRAIGDAGRRNSDPMLSPNQDSAAAGQGVTGPAGGNIHDTSSSSAEILHYPEEANLASSKAGASVAQDNEVKMERASPSRTPVNESSGKACDSRDEVLSETSETFHATLKEVSSSESAEDLSPKVQNLIPSSSSVFTGQENLNNTSISAGEPMQADGSPAKLPIAVISPTTDSKNSEPLNSIEASSASYSSTSSMSCSTPRTIPSGSDVPDHTHLNCSADTRGEAKTNKNCASQSSQLGKDMALTISVPSSSSSSSPSLLSPSLQNGSSLLSERLALNNEISVRRLDRTNCRSLSTTSLGATQDKSAQHSIQGSEDIDIASKLKAGALLDSSRKNNSVLTSSKSAVGALSNGVTLSQSKPGYPNGISTSTSQLGSPASKHVHGQQNGSGEDTAQPQAMSESTDTLVEQPLGVDIKLNGMSSVKRVSKSGASLTSSSSVSPSSSYSPPSLLIASPQRRELSSTPDSPQNIQSRRARAASGASRDLSVSPCNTCKGTWTDTGRLRNPSGGGEMASRRWLGATVATSTTDISDSFVGKVGTLWNVELK